MAKSRNIAIIPARGGSKRIPRKNIKEFFGKPIIAYSIEAAINSGLFDEVMVSTDDEEIAKTAVKYGATTPFMRSSENSDDHVGIADVLIEVIEKYSEKDKRFDNVCCILATAPFVEDNHIKEAYLKLVNSSFDSVFPVVRYSFPIQRAMQFVGDRIKMIWPENLLKRSQDLKPSYHDAGLFYWVRNDVLLSERTLWTDNTTGYEISEQVAQDIDTPEDWRFAELKYKIIHGKT